MLTSGGGWLVLNSVEAPAQNVKLYSWDESLKRWKWKRYRIRLMVCVNLLRSQECVTLG